MEKEKGRKSAEAVKAKTRRRHLRKKEIRRLQANRQKKSLTGAECPSGGEIEEPPVDNGMHMVFSKTYDSVLCLHFKLFM